MAVDGQTRKRAREIRAPTGRNSFGRVYAVYGGFFIVLSFLFGWWLDGDRPDLGDVVGGAIALVGVLVVLFWPR
jgi:small multidrug resistance family-3 protein